MSAQTGFAVKINKFGWRHPGRARWALRDVTLDIDAGQRVLIAGASGSGKSTLLRCIAGLVDAEDAAESTGSINYFTSGSACDVLAARRNIGLMMQDPETNLLLTRVGDDVAFGLENASIPTAAIWPRVHQALEEVGFRYSIDRPTSALSGGEKQRVGLAGSLVREPKLLILDEPTANLDPAGARLTVNALTEVIDRSQSTVIMVEHRLPDVYDLIDRIVLLSPEGILADGEPADVLANKRQLFDNSGIFVPGWQPPQPARTTPAGNDIVLSAHAVSVVRGAQQSHALDSVSLDIVAGSVTAIVGHNGAGKSTLARVLGGLLKPTTGSATTRGMRQPLHKLPAKKLATVVGSVFQEPEHQFVARTVATELTAGARAVGLGKAEAHARAHSLLDQLGLTHLADANPYTLSGGEKRRLAVAAALVANPPVLILDEPTFGQDANSWSTVAKLLCDQNGAGTALVIVTHDQHLVDYLGAKVVTLTDGRVRAGDTTMGVSGGTATSAATAASMGTEADVLAPVSQGGDRT